MAYIQEEIVQSELSLMHIRVIVKRKLDADESIRR